MAKKKSAPAPAAKPKLGVAVMIGMKKGAGPNPDGGPGALREMNSDLNSGDSSDSSGTQVTVPIDSLSVEGTPPEMGDSVSFNVEGTVKSVDGNNAVVEVTAIDGQAVDNSSSGDENMSAMGSRLRNKAAASSGGY
jgi:hypothetical protein